MEGVDLRVDIDPYRLDDEWLGQAKQLLKWTENLAESRLDFDRSKAQLDVVKAELDQKIREDPIAYGLPKITETAIQNTSLLQPELKKAIKDVDDRRFDMGMVQAAVNSLEHRRKALENLVSLHGMQYFAEPKEPEGKAEEVQEVQKKKIRTMWSKAKSYE